MTESIFSIFPDGQLAGGNGLKGKAPRSKKQALCDVKNTLQSKQTIALDEPLKKTVPLDSCGFSTDSKKWLSVKETPAKLSSKQGGTFVIASDPVAFEEQENLPCVECLSLEDFMLLDRPSYMQLKHEDFDYLAKGLFSSNVEVFSSPDPPELLPELFIPCDPLDSGDGVEVRFFPFLTSLEEPELIPLSDDDDEDE